jgi:hypothetical protein
VNGIGIVHPAATSREMSARCNSFTMAPDGVRTTEIGIVSGREYTSTRYFPSGENEML